MSYTFYKYRVPRREIKLCTDELHKFNHSGLAYKVDAHYFHSLIKDLSVEIQILTEKQW